MAVLIGAWMPLVKLEEIVETLKMKNLKGFNMTIGVNDETNEYGQNVSLYAEQTKEQREAKADRYFCGNGKVFWTNGKVEVAEKKEKVTKTPSNQEIEKPKASDEAPF